MSPHGVDIVTVCLDVEGREGASPDLDKVDDLTHAAVVDEAHAVDAALGIVNVPMAVWIDEELRIVRPAEGAWPAERGPSSLRDAVGELPERLQRMGAAAARIKAPNRDTYAAMVRDWAERGTDSEYVLPPDEVLAGSGERGTDEATAAAEFDLGQHLHRHGRGDEAVAHFREAHRLQPDNWTYKRQAWELASRIDGPVGRFWQGPVPGREDEWPYEGDWLTDVERSGPENYYAR